MRNAQLLLIEPTPSRFRIDHRTKELGMAGIAAARAALLEAAERRTADTDLSKAA